MKTALIKFPYRRSLPSPAFEGFNPGFKAANPMLFSSEEHGIIVSYKWHGGDNSLRQGSRRIWISSEVNISVRPYQVLQQFNEVPLAHPFSYLKALRTGIPRLVIVALYEFLDFCGRERVPLDFKEEMRDYVKWQFIAFNNQLIPPGTLDSDPYHAYYAMCSLAGWELPNDGASVWNASLCHYILTFPT